MTNQESVIGAFGEEDAAKLTGLSIGQLRRWDTTGFLAPSYAESNRRLPFSRVYSFRDIVSLRVLGMLRNRYHIPMQHLRKVSDRLSHLGDDRWIKTTLYVLGKRVVFEDPTTKKRSEVVSGQGVFDIPLQVVVTSTRNAIADLNKRSYDELGQIVQLKFVQANELTFKGSRVSVSAVKRYLDAGFETSKIIEEFPELTIEDIEAARVFVLPDAAA